MKAVRCDWKLKQSVDFIHKMFYSYIFLNVERFLPQRRPHLTGCVSANMETFRCRWNVGSFQNLSEPGELRLFYIDKNLHVSIHYYWLLQPDPPVDLNWVLLNVSLTGTHYDIMLSWKPPQSADVEMGWMTLQYEVQYRDSSSDLWEVLDLVKTTQRSIFGLQTNVNHEVRIRCKMPSGKEFGEFSSSVFVHIPSKESSFPVAALLIFGALCLVAILMLFIISQQEKLMVILLPPVPGPKIKGIDPELLKSGKLRELTSILGGPPDLRPELYNSDPWVEFIDLDIEEQNDRLTGLDTDCLVDRSLSSNCSPVSISFRDDDSGRASCCDPDLPSDPEASPFHPLIPNQTLSNELPCAAASDQSSSVLGRPKAEPLFVALGRETMYTQVSEVRSSGRVLLSPEGQTEVEKTTSKDSKKDIIPEKEKKKDEFQLVVNTDDGGYTSELNAWKMNLRSSEGDVSEPRQTEGDVGSSPLPSPSYEPDATAQSQLPPPPVYTMVDGVDRQNSLLLTPNPTPALQLMMPKTLPLPDGYLTPDLLRNVTP
uniref:Fibronectin type-III domain-containing protein n=1 Tax=Anabas testudineus TaxID=64144 RepID=A0A7N6AN94_ANATE